MPETVYEKTADGVTLTVIDRTGTYDYQWSEFAVMRGSDGWLYVGATSGCSCNYFEENLSPNDVVKVSSWQDAANRAQRWAAGEDYGVGEQYGPYEEDEKRAGMDLVERLAKSQPVAFDASAVSA
jgi:hypothetical protein